METLEFIAGTREKGFQPSTRRINEQRGSQRAVGDMRHMSLAAATQGIKTLELKSCPIIIPAGVAAFQKARPEVTVAR